MSDTVLERGVEVLARGGGEWLCGGFFSSGSYWVDSVFALVLSPKPKKLRASIDP